MKRANPWAFPLVFITGVLLMTACTGDSPSPDQEEETLEPPVNRIVYVGEDSQIYTVDQEGLDRQQVTSEAGFYTWPTWSPDSKSLVVSAALGDPPEADTLGLYKVATDSSELKQVYANLPSPSPFIAPGIIHYPTWSPDSQKVAFLSQTPSGQTLYLGHPQEEATPRFLADGAPLYLVWSPSSRYLLMHVGQGHFLLDMETDGPPRDLGIESSSYRTPTWSPSSHRFAVVGMDDIGSDVLFTADLDGEDHQRLAEIEDTAVFLWGPGGDSIALGRSSFGSNLYMDGLALLSLDGREERAIVGDSVLAFFWSPDGEKIAYFSPSEEQGLLFLSVVDVKTGSSLKLVEFQPSPELLTLLVFFDQYASSHALWSPDNLHLVISGNVRGAPSLVQAAPTSPPSVYVIDVTGLRPPTLVASGPLAFWSPR